MKLFPTSVVIVSSGSTTYNQYTVADEFVGPPSYTTGGMVIDMSKTMSSLNSVDLVVKKGSRGANLPAVRYETTLNSPSAGKATVKIVRKQVSEVSALGTVNGQPTGVTIRAASGVASSSDQNSVVSDSFTRADNPTSLGVADTGQTWTPQSGTWGIQTGKAYMTTTTSSGHATIAGPLNGRLSNLITTTATADRTDRGIVLKWIDSSNFIVILIEDLAGFDRFCTLYKVDSGVATNLASSVAGAQWTPGNVVDLSIEFTAELLVGYIGGVEKFRYSMTASEVTKYNGSSTCGMIINAGAALDDNVGRNDSFLGTFSHYHTIDHNHASFNSGSPSDTGASVLLDVLGPNHSTHTHALDLPVFTGATGVGSSHTHQDNSIYQHQHGANQTSTVYTSSEISNATNLSGTTWLLAVTGVKL